MEFPWREQVFYTNKKGQLRRKVIQDTSHLISVTAVPFRIEPRRCEASKIISVTRLLLENPPLKGTEYFRHLHVKSSRAGVASLLQSSYILMRRDSSRSRDLFILVNNRSLRTKNQPIDQSRPYKSLPEDHQTSRHHWPSCA